MTLSRIDRTRRRRLANHLAEGQGGVASRSQLASLGISRHDIGYEIDGGRWRRYGHQTVAVHNGPLAIVARCWAAVFETGAGIAAIDGATALQHAGLKGYVDHDIHVSAVHNHNTRRLAGVKIHKVVRRVAGELVEAGLPRTRPEVAAIRAAHWAASDRQAALVLLMTVQQHLTTPARLAAAQRLVRGRTRRAFIRAVVRDIAFGVQSLGELDFGRLCRARGLPEPSRQVVRQTPGGRIYLDVAWDEFDLVVEIDGAQHRWGLAVMNDNLRQNDVTLSGDRVLRIDVIGLRLETDRFFEQVERGLSQRRAA
jgi:very-short-patch-repair endonuclease